MRSVLRLGSGLGRGDDAIELPIVIVYVIRRWEAMDIA